MAKEAFLDNAVMDVVRDAAESGASPRAQRQGSIWRWLGGSLLVLALVIGAGLPAAAHVELASSTPADGSSLGAPVESIELTFSVEAVPAGEGIQIFDEAGVAVAATVTQVAPTLVRLDPLQPLGMGDYSVSWFMRAGDAHPRTGTVAFTVDVPRPSVVTPPAQDAALASSEPVGAAPPAIPGERAAAFGRLVTLLGGLIAVGTLTFASIALYAKGNEMHTVVHWVRRAGLAVMAGTVVEALAASRGLTTSLWGALAPGSIAGAVSGSFGFALALRLGGGLALFRGVSAAAYAVDPPGSPGRADHAPGAGVSTATISRAEPRSRFDIDQSLLAVGGATAIVVSYVFDGHTVTAGPALLARVADVVHVAAAGVWVGGVVFLARTLAGRHRRREPLEAAEMTIRFSQIAAVALAAVGAAGLALTWMILDSPGELFSTTWGRVLLAKLAFVGTAVALGGYNHRVVVPTLTDDHDEANAHRLRRVVRFEGGVLVVIVALTAMLVGAAS